MAKLKEELWTAVRHSGAGYGGNLGFMQGLEERIVLTEAQRDRIKKVGGVLFSTYKEIADYCEKEQYPPTVVNVYPKAPGMFSKHKIDGLNIYVPAHRLEGRLLA